MRQTSLFQTVKAAALYHVPIKSYSKNTHPPSFLKRAVVGINQITTAEMTVTFFPISLLFLCTQKVSTL